MRFSVIIPVYNRPEMVRRAINSVISQTFSASEIIVINDGSKDVTGEVVRKLSDTVEIPLHIIEHQKNRGVSAARNSGIKAAENEWIALLDSDDEWKPEKLARQQEFHQQHPDLKISQCNEIWVRNGNRVKKRDIHRKIGGRIFKESLKLCLVSPSATVIHQSVFEDIGYFDESLPACEDYDFWLRALVKYPIGLLDEPLLIRYGGHSDQLSAKYWGMDRWRVKAMEKHLNENLPQDWKIALYEELIAKLEVLHQGAEKRDKPEAEVYQEKIRRYSEELYMLRSLSIL